MQLRFGYVWGEDCRYLGPDEYHFILATGIQNLRLHGVEIDVHIKTHPRFMDEWADLLVSTVFLVKSSYFVFGFIFVEGISPLVLVFHSTSSLKVVLSQKVSFLLCMSNYAIAFSQAPAENELFRHRHLNDS